MPKVKYKITSYFLVTELLVFKEETNTQTVSLSLVLKYPAAINVTLSSTVIIYLTYTELNP